MCTEIFMRRKTMEAKELLKRYNEKERDFRGANLSWVNLSETDLHGIDLRGADLRGADLSGADLRGADLRGALLRETDLRGANLEYSSLQYIRYSAGRHELTATEGQIQIGCEIHPIGWWLEDYIAVGESHGYSTEEIKKYGTMIKICAEYFSGTNSATKGNK